MGFWHGESFVITSAFDGAVFDVKRARTANGSKVITWNFNSEPNQIWTANNESGGFRLMATHVSNDMRVLDQGDGSTKLLIWRFHGGNNQLWNAFPVSDNAGVFYIQNVQTGMCVRNMGLGNQMECSAFNEHDVNTHWRIQPLSSM